CTLAGHCCKGDTSPNSLNVSTLPQLGVTRRAQEFSANRGPFCSTLIASDCAIWRTPTAAAPPSAPTQRTLGRNVWDRAGSQSSMPEDHHRALDTPSEAI